jgi:DNA-directed RNA polymerase specialized sigma24 family protein
MESAASQPVSPVPPESVAAADRVLAPFLEARDSETAREALGELLESQARPLLQAVARRQLGGSAPVQEGQDVEDVVAGALLRLAEQLWSSRGARSAPIESFAGYVVATAQNACHAFLRRRQPERARLRSRVRYLLTHDSQLALWEGPAGEPLCGLAAWRGRTASAVAARRLAEMRGRIAADTGAGGLRPQALAFARLVRELLARAAGPCRLAELVTLLEDILGIVAGPSASSEGLSDDSGEAAVASPEPSPGDVVERRDELERLWAEIRLLPRHQRVALLLNLRDAGGRGMIGLLPLVGLATQADIAATLEMPPPRLAAIWEDLPREDDWIAGELGVTRRQVINFRKCARERLWRRMRQAETA